MAAKDWRPGPTVCRCCFAEGCYKDISTEYFWMGKREVYSEMLNETFDVSIAYSQISGPNSNSRLICEPCISRLRDASDFKRQVQECEKTFMHHLDPGRAMEVEVTLDRVEKEEVKLERVKQEQKLSDDDFEPEPFADEPDDDDEDPDDQPLTKLASKVPKKESMDLLDLLDNAKPEKRKSSTKVKASPSKKPKKKEAPKPGASKASVKVVEKKKKDVEVNNTAIILKHTTAYPFRVSQDKRIRCCFCKGGYEDPRLFRMHVDTAHSIVNRAKATKSIKHGAVLRVDITELRCKNCDESFSSLESISKHLNDEHNLGIDLSQNVGLAPMKLDMNRFECLRCLKKFSGLTQWYKHASSHMIAAYVCDVCGKTYETVGGIKQHKKLVHLAQNFRCATCKKTFPSMEAKKQHRKLDKTCLPYRCNVCGESFLFWDRRETHLNEAHGKPATVHRCSVCDKNCKGRRALYFHFKATHTDDHKCQYCGLKFKARLLVQEHIRYKHTGERPFQCEVCDKAFASKKSLQNHEIIHDDSKKSACSICGRLFAAVTKLRQHVRKHHPDDGV